MPFSFFFFRSDILTVDRSPILIEDVHYSAILLYGGTPLLINYRQPPRRLMIN